MPELPEVETMRRGIAGVKGSRIREIARVRCRLRPIEVEPALPSMRKRVVGKQVASVDRHGKRVVLRLEDDERLAHHDEPIYRNGELVGRTTSGMWSYVEGRCLAMGYLTPADDDEVIETDEAHEDAIPHLKIHFPPEQRTERARRLKRK